jgi:lyso-ornithine lipid O-acyltransferase
LFQPALLTRSAIQPVVLQYQGEAKQHAPFIGDDDFISHLIKMLSLDKIEVHVSFLPVIKSSGKNRHSVGIEAREMISEKISGDILVDNSDFPCMKSSVVQKTIRSHGLVERG